MTALPRRAPTGRGLVLKLFAVCALVAVVAVLAATWVTVQATVVAEHQERQQSLHADAVVYDALVGYAAQHGDWSGAAGLVDGLSARFGHDITVTDARGDVLLASGASAARLPVGQARATIDPTEVDSAVATGQDAPAAAAPQGDGLAPSTPTTRIVSASPQAEVDRRITAGWSAERRARVSAAVAAGADRCLGSAAVHRVTELAPRLTALVDRSVPQQRVDACLRSALRSALAGGIAPPALLFVQGGGATAAVFWDFSGTNRLRIASAAGAVLAVIVLLCAVLAAQIVRPLRRMAEAATLAGEGDLGIRVPARRRDELGDVARAFNHMADRRQQLEAARQQMMSDVSHELRAPLTNIRGWLEAAQDGLARTDDRLVASLYEETLQLQRLVDDVHQLATGDAGATRLEPEPVAVRAFLEQVAAAFAATAQRAGVRLEVAADPRAVLHADQGRLRQAVTNLVANSLRHSSPGGVVRLFGDGGKIGVADDGEGIPADAVETVFDRFRRVDASRSRATGGSGLGLAIVRQYIESEGGEAHLESALGVGTTVTLRYPRVPLPSDAARGRP